MRACEVEGCERTYYAKGFCVMHYARWRQHGDVGKAEPMLAPRGSRSQTRCRVDGCNKEVLAIRLCAMHRARLKKTGKVGPAQPISRRVSGPPTMRLWTRVHKADAAQCWEWSGAIAKSGYGSMGVDGKNVYVHRFAYEQTKGPIPEGMHIDHLCGNPRCVNPAHLEAVTQAENNRRARERAKMLG